MGDNFWELKFARRIDLKYSTHMYPPTHKVIIWGDGCVDHSTIYVKSRCTHISMYNFINCMSVKLCGEVEGGEKYQPTIEKPKSNNKK